MRELWIEVKWDSRSDQEREKEERRWEWPLRSSNAFFKFCFLESTSSSASEIALRSAISELEEEI